MGADRDPNENPNSKIWRTAFIVLLVIVILAVAIGGPRIGSRFQGNTASAELTYSEFWQQVEAKNVTDVVLTGQLIEGSLAEPVEITLSSGEKVERDAFRSYMPATGDESLVPFLKEQGVEIDARPVGSNSWLSTLFTFGPFLLLIGLAILIFRRAPSQGDGLTSMLKSKARVYGENNQPITFADIAGSAGAKQELQEVIDFLLHPERFQSLGATIPKGVLLIGPPGTGKTLLARAVAGEAKATFYSISGSDFMELYVGVGASRVRDLFQQAKQHAPAIIFIDELDSIGRRRGAGVGGGHDEREQTLNQLLVEMDGFEKNENVIVMAATNRPDILDPALQRPGRFDRQITVDSPTMAERVEILKIHSRNKPLAAGVDLEAVARGTPGFSGADLANLLNEAALLAARAEKKEIGLEELNEASDKVVMGLERSLALTAEELRVLAYHEAGHAVLGAVLPYADPIHKVNIIPRGRAMGVTQQIPERDRYLYPRDYMIDRMTVIMGGRAAEEIAIGSITSGAADDLKQATRLARRMVMDWGMSDRVGHVAWSAENGYADEYAVREFSDYTARELDQEIRRMVEECYSRARDLLNTHREGLDHVVEVLLEKEQIYGAELEGILQKYPPA